MAPRRLPWLRGPTPATATAAAADTNIADSSLPTPGFLPSSPPPHPLLGLGGSNSNPNIQLEPPPTPPSPWPWPAAAYSSSSSSSSPPSSSPSSVRAHLDQRHHQTTKVLFPAPPHPANTQALGDDGGASINRRRRTTSTASTGSRGDRRRSRHPKFVAASRGYGRYLLRVMEYVAARLHQGGTAAATRTAAVQLPHHHQIQVIGAADHHPPPPLRTGNRGSAVQRRRVDLEQEVAELKKQLSNEQTVHDILERALHHNSARSIVLNIPAFIPKKAKELLAELVLVEEEISRLEGQIDKMKGGLSAMQQERSVATSYPSQSQGTNGNGGTAAENANGTAHAPDDVKPPQAGKVAPEIKSMFFISQAISGEYLKRHLGDDDDKVKSPQETAAVRRGAAMSPKYNIYGLPPRNSLDKQSDHRTVEKPPKIFQEPSAMKIQPNKLSERIVKCLVCIFIRLLRSSRVAELEKSGNLARSGNLQGSFRIDTGLNVTGSVAKDKERGQQDHYGIFGILDSIVRDIGPYKNLVRFTSSSFDLRGFSSSPLLTKLREMLEALQQVDLRFLTHQQKLAFWLNIYNTCIMHGILQHGLPSNSEKLLALKNKGTINVSGQMFNALVVENFILRQPSSVKEEFWKCDVDVEEQEVRGLYGLNNSEPNILFALCCGIRSSPALRIYKPDRVIVDLEKAKLDYLQASLVVTSTRKLMIPSLIHSNMHDFAKDMESLVGWICDQLPTSWSLRKSMVDCLRGQSHLKIEGVVDVIPYDYEFQYLLPM